MPLGCSDNRTIAPMLFGRKRVSRKYSRAHLSSPSAVSTQGCKRSAQARPECRQSSKGIFPLCRPSQGSWLSTVQRTLLQTGSNRSTSEDSVKSSKYRQQKESGSGSPQKYTLHFNIIPHFFAYRHHFSVLFEGLPSQRRI